MTAPSRRNTPCVGICSTTYGDLVCRGCKRFAHEITQWNGYSEEQRESIWQRLSRIEAQVLKSLLTLRDPARYSAALARYRLELATDGDWVTVAYELLRRAVRDAPQLSELGLQHVGQDEAVDEVLPLLKLIDREIYARGTAHFERNFRVSAEQ